MKMNRSRKFLNSLNELKAHISTTAKSGSKVPTHYETLNVERDSTQDDIKSAYYELSKKFHPDKNKSVDAKKKFQNVSDAYEVLGNFIKRKQYDRDLAARGDRATKQRVVYEQTQEDPLSGFYKSRQANYDPIKNQGPANFDFDEWTRAHYGYSLKKSLSQKNSRQFRERIKAMQANDEELHKANLKLITIVAITLSVFLLIQAHIAFDNFDRNLVDKNDLSKQNRSKNS